MERQQLLDLLKQMHDELSEVENVDSETLAALQSVNTDVQRVMHLQEEATDRDVEPVRSRLEELILEYEAAHPQLTAMLQRVVDGLANLGI